MPKKVSKKEVVEVIEKPKRGRKKKVEPEPASPMVDSQPADVPKKKPRKKKPVVVVEEVKQEVKEVKTSKKAKAPKDESKAKDETKPKKSNRWLIHVKDFRSKNQDMKYSDVLKEAKKTYTK